MNLQQFVCMEHLKTSWMALAPAAWVDVEEKKPKSIDAVDRVCRPGDVADWARKACDDRLCPSSGSTARGAFPLCDGKRYGSTFLRADKLMRRSVRCRRDLDGGRSSTVAQV